MHDPTQSSASRARLPHGDAAARLEALLEAARLIAAALDLEALYLALHRQFRRVVDATGFALVLSEREGADLHVVLRVLGDVRQPPERYPWGNGVTEYVWRTGRPLLLADRAWERARALGCQPRAISRPRSWILAPVRIADRTLGVLYAHNDERDGAFDEVDLRILVALASHVAVALENARLLRAARAAEARYRSVFEASPLVVLVLDETGRIVESNPAGARLFGHERDALRGLRVPELAAPGHRELVESLVAQACAGSLPARREIRFLRPDGSERATGFSVGPLGPEGGGAAVAVIRDVTHEVELRQHLLQTEKLAALGRLLAGIAHELNNPLAGVRAALELLLEEARPDQCELLAMALRETDRVSRVVEGVREFGRRSAGERVRVNLNDLVQRAAALRGYALRNQNIELVTECDPRLPECVADPDEIFQALLNLLQNAEQAVACKAEGPRRITLVTRARPDAVELAVIDTGPGVPPEIRDRVFDPFFTTRAPGEGTGLGLTVVHTVVEAHEGQTFIEETPGGGATLRVVLPLLPVRGAKRTRPEPAPRSSVAGLRVLLAEDEAAIREVVARWAARQGIRLTAVADGEAALRAIREGNFDVILLDVRMPGTDGRAVYRALERERPELLRRVVFVTGDAVAGATRAFLEEVRRPVLAKPFDLGTLADRIGEVAAEAGAAS